MRERIAAVGGVVRFSSTGKGFELRVEVPMAREAAA
jgi:signal transduction histidine kinase